MNQKRVKDLMVPLADYAVVRENDTLYDAIMALDKAQKKLPEGRQPHRAILVVDNNDRITGKIGHLAFIKALEPQYRSFGGMAKLGTMEMDSSVLSSMMQHYNFFQDSLSDICQRASKIKAREAMHPLKESVSEDMLLGEAVHKLVIWRTLSILVTRKSKPVGLLRISDVFDEIAREIKNPSGSEG